MSDPQINELERELSKLRPANPPSHLADALREEPADEPLTFADRILVTFSGLGAIAAAVIVAVIVSHLASSPSPPSPADLVAQRERAATYQQLLASR